MKSINAKVFTIAIAFAVVLSIPPSVGAQDTAALYKSKCAGCHGADGAGSAMGKKMGAHEFTSDEDLTSVITNGRNKMPKYGSLKPEEIKGLVAYIRALKK